MISKVVESIGIELECGITTKGANRLVDRFSKWPIGANLNIGSDISVKVNRNPGLSILDNREIRFYSDKWVDIKHFLKWAYEYGAKTDSSCGFHLHVEFVNHEFTLLSLAEKKFVSDFLHEYLVTFSSFEQHEKYLSRLSNKYSKRNTESSATLKRIVFDGDWSDRRVAVNFSSVNKHKRQIVTKTGRSTMMLGTLEFRVFPNQNSAEEAITTVTWLVDVLDKLVPKYTSRPIKIVL